MAAKTSGWRALLHCPIYGQFADTQPSLPTTAPQTTQPRLALLSNGVSPHNDNHARITAALTADGWQIRVFAHDEISLFNGVVRAGGVPLAEFDLVWMLGLGERGDFIDRCQILANLPAGKMLNSAIAMLTLHSKHIHLPHSPLTASGNRVEELLHFTERHQEVTRWVVKPAAGSYGRGVMQTDSRESLEQALKRSTAGRNYCVVQAFVEEITAGETRCLVVNEEIVGSYLRIPDRSFLANLTQGARSRKTMLDTQEIAQVEEIAHALAQRGVRFAAIDMAFPHLIEVNIANPGGLATLASLGGHPNPNIGARLARALRRTIA